MGADRAQAGSQLPEGSPAELIEPQERKDLSRKVTLRRVIVERKPFSIQVHISNVGSGIRLAPFTDQRP